MLIALLFAAAAVALGAQAVSAQDLTTSFRGFRVEGNIGVDRFQSQGKHNDKLGYGATIGFDGMIVIGPEASYWRANNWSQNCSGDEIGGSICHKSFEEWGAAVRRAISSRPNCCSSPKAVM